MKILPKLIFVISFFFVPVAAQAQITGLEFLNIAPDAKIGDIIAAIYVYGVGFVALAALIVFTAGGVRYIFAGDKDPSEAKSWMKNAFWGLVLALTSWLILYTINPELVKNIGNLDLQTIQTTNITSPGGIDRGDGSTCSPVCRQGYVCVRGGCTPSPCFTAQLPQYTQQACAEIGCGYSGSRCIPR